MAGLPTVSLYIPDTLPVSVPQGVYAAKAGIGYDIYPGLLWYAPNALAGGDAVLEFYPLDTVAFYAGEGSTVNVEIVHSLRSPKQFDIPEQLAQAFAEDIRHARTYLHI